MKSEKFSLKVTKTARIFKCGEVGTSDALIVLHGYGFLAEYFIRHFEFLPSLFPDLCVYAPEGLSRFYKEGFYGQVGASWMTKEDRESEIQDQHAYLDQLVRSIHQKNPETRIHLLGFSQGVSTAWRWVNNGITFPVSFVLWAGEIPAEYSETLRLRLDSIPLFHVCGTEDEFISAEMAENQFVRVQTAFPHIKKRYFTGKHTLDKNLLTEIYTELLKQTLP